jgi:hypothetical protein
MIPRERVEGAVPNMPVARYFLFVGGVLLALLLAFDAYAPGRLVADRAETAADLPAVRFHSDRGWPVAVVFDTSLPTITPAAVPVLTATADAAIPAPTVIADVSAGSRVRDAFAQFAPVYPKRPESKPQAKRKIANSRLASPTVLVAQQPRLGFFANNTW